jgi:hypothetical protein
MLEMWPIWALLFFLLFSSHIFNLLAALFTLTMRTTPEEVSQWMVQCIFQAAKSTGDGASIDI